MTYRVFRVYNGRKCYVSNVPPGAQYDWTFDTQQADVVSREEVKKILKKVVSRPEVWGFEPVRDAGYR